MIIMTFDIVICQILSKEAARGDWYKAFLGFDEVSSLTSSFKHNPV